MAKSVCLTVLVAAGFVLIPGVSWATDPNAWLMKNYRFTGPPPPGSGQPVDPVVNDLKQVQNMLMSVMRKANFSEDWETAIIAGSQAAANAQTIGIITERLEANAAAKAKAEASKPEPPTYSIAFKDRSIESAVAYWSDGMMFHYITLSGAHIQVRQELVDRNLSAKINKARGVEFNLQ
jgi:hypothetical protein